MATLLLYCVLLRYAIARPTRPTLASTPSFDSFSSVYATATETPPFDTMYRSTVEIVWSCLTVIIASSWLCVHPNVTGHSTTMWQRLRERLALFAIALFAPEIMAVFAYYQWRGSHKLYEEFKERADRLDMRLWKLTSGVSTRGTESPNDTKGQDSSACGGSNPNAIGESSALHKSEKPLKIAGNGETGRQWAFGRFWMGVWSSIKAVLSFGTEPKTATWSYTHAHFVQMGGIAFRDKGKVGFKRPKEWTDEDLESFFTLKLTEEAVSDKSKAGALAKTLVAARVLWFLIQAIARKAQGLPIALLEVASIAFIVFHFAMYVFWWNKPLDVAYPLEIPGSPGKERTLSRTGRLSLAAYILMGVLDFIPIGSWLYSPTRQWYPRLYSFGKKVEVLDDEGNLKDTVDVTFRRTIAVTSSCFGAFHVIGWYLPAPTEVERKLWRVSCLVLTVYPFPLIAVLLFFNLFLPHITPQTRFATPSNTLITIMSWMLGIPGSIAYIGARLTVLFLPFFELRDLPPLVHRTVSWSRFLSPI